MSFWPRATWWFAILPLGEFFLILACAVIPALWPLVFSFAASLVLAMLVWQSRSFPMVYGPLFLFAMGIGCAAAVIIRADLTLIKLSDFVVLFSISLALLYSFLFLIAPEFNHGRGLVRPGPAALAILIILGFISTGCFMAAYADKVFLEGSDPCKLQLTLLIRSVQKMLGLPGTFETLMLTMIDLHFIVISAIFTLIDVVFLLYANGRRDRVKFARLVFIVDVPIIVAVLATLGAKSRFNSAANIFESGAISFQFVSGSLAAYMIENRLEWRRAIYSNGTMFPLRLDPPYLFWPLLVGSIAVPFFWLLKATLRNFGYLA